MLIKHKQSVTRFQRVSPEKLAKAKAMRRNMTPAERCFWNAVRANKIEGMHFHRQQVIDGFIADFYCGDQRLVIEIDGGIHETQKDYDSMRETALKKNGLRVIRFSNQEVINDVDLVIQKLKKYVKEA
jgi:very-short-patch-repair endonuclease